jgi:hypothetical protein
MLIRKLFKFENAHIVRGCSTRSCAHSIHGHSYKVELLLEALALDHGQMVYDFGLLKDGPRVGLIALEDIEFSEAIRNEWPNHDLFDKLKRGERTVNSSGV